MFSARARVLLHSFHRSNTSGVLRRRNMSGSADPFATTDPIALTKRLNAAAIRIYESRSCFSDFEAGQCADIFAELQRGYVLNGQLSKHFNLLLKINDKQIKLSHETTAEELLPFAKPASFGRGFESAYDETVRKCMSIDGANIAADRDYASLDCHHLYHLAPEGSRLYARLSKIHLYGPGGFFAEHADTAQGKGHVATFVVLLGSPHTGGALRVKGDAVLSQPSEPGTLAWAAFPPDVPHCVDEVTSGHRATVQFDIFACRSPTEIDGSKGPIFPVNKEDENQEGEIRQFGHVATRPHEESLKLADSYWEEVEESLDDQGAFAVLLSHRYSWGTTGDLTLRGADIPLIAALRARHPDWRVSFHSVLVTNVVDDDMQICFTKISPFDPEYVSGSKSPDSIHGLTDVPLLEHVVPKDSELSPEGFSKGYLGNEPDSAKYFYIHMVALIQTK